MCACVRVCGIKILAELLMELGCSSLGWGLLPGHANDDKDDYDDDDDVKFNDTSVHEGHLCHYDLLTLFLYMKNLTLQLPVTTTVICFRHLLVILKVIFANSADPDQTAPLGAVWSGSTLFACMQK